MGNRKATWDIQLHTHCPGCELSFDLMKDSDFKADLQCDPLETDSHRSTDVWVSCPHCSEDFTVDFEY